jgi:hypothetical protein
LLGKRYARNNKNVGSGVFHKIRTQLQLKECPCGGGWNISTVVLRRWFREIKMNRRAFVSRNRMRAGHTSLKASLNRFNLVSTAECESGLKTEEHIFWDCNLYEDQRATMMDILSENCKKEYPKSVTELLKLEEKRFVQGVCYFINKIPKFILKREKEVNVQNINRILLKSS